MNHPPKIQALESYLEKVKEFFAWNRGFGEYEVGALNITEEQKDNITLIDLLCPSKDKIIRAKPGCLENGNLKETESILGNQVEMISTRRNCWFSRNFYSRINTLSDGYAHNHFNVLFPSGHDVIATMHSLHRTNPNHRYAIGTIHHDGGFDIFCFLKQDLNYLTELEALTEELASRWLHDNYARIHVENYNVRANK